MQAKHFDVTALPYNHNFDCYMVKDLLGPGVFGITYKAKDLNLRKTVAIKEYYPNSISSRQRDFSIQPISEKYKNEYYAGLQHFTQTARKISRLKHSNFARVYSFFEANNSAYMIMRYEPGQSIKRIRTTRQFTEAELMNIAAHILDALEFVHKGNFIHKDIRPENIILRENGSPVLINFDSTSDTYGQSKRNLSSLISSEYAPIERYPEKSKFDKQGEWTEIYSMSATLYYMISGIAPSSAITRADSILQTNRDTCVPIELIADSQYSKELLRAIDRGLAFRQKDRPQSISEWRSMFDYEKLNMTV